MRAKIEKIISNLIKLHILMCVENFFKFIFLIFS